MRTIHLLWTIVIGLVGLFHGSADKKAVLSRGHGTASEVSGRTVGGSPTNISDTAYLQVFTLLANDGTLTTPIGQLTNSGSCYCSAGFDKLAVFTGFAGPNVAQPPTPNFPNPDNLTSLTIETFGNDPTIETAVQIQRSTAPFSPVWCNDDAPNHGKLSQATASPLVATWYRVGISYKSSPLPAGTTNIIWHWSYQ